MNILNIYLLFNEFYHTQMILPWRRAWGGDGGTAPAACRSHLGLLACLGRTLEPPADRGWRGEGEQTREGIGSRRGDGGNSSCRGWPAVAGVGEEMASRRPKSRGWRSAGGGRSLTLAICEREGLGGVTGPNIGLWFAPLVTCSVPINRSDSPLIGLTTDYLPINRAGQLM
jgi:hypothetical protein